LLLGAPGALGFDAYALAGALGLFTPASAF